MTIKATEETRNAVAELYEEHPYPDHGIVSTVVARMARPLIERARQRTTGRKVRVLDAGCGTGEQTLGLASTYPQAEIVGIDVNSRSLERAAFYSTRHGIPVRFARHDLLSDETVESLGQFDVIISVGVIHCLPEPARALANLTSIGSLGAEILGMVYGRFGKATMFSVRDAIRLLSGTDDRATRLTVLNSLRRPRSDALLELTTEILRRRRFGPDIAITEAVARAVSGRNRAYSADSYTHPFELVFTWAEVDALLQESGWSWMGWPPRSGMPDQPKALFNDLALERARHLSTLELAAIYERFLLPSNLYFVARKR